MPLVIAFKKYLTGNIQDRQTAHTFREEIRILVADDDDDDDVQSCICSLTASCSTLVMVQWSLAVPPDHRDHDDDYDDDSDDKGDTDDGFTMYWAIIFDGESEELVMHSVCCTHNSSWEEMKGVNVFCLTAACQKQTKGKKSFADLCTFSENQL